MKLDLPQIEVTQLSNLFQPASLRHGDVEAIEKGFHWADPNFFDVVPLPAYAGNLKTALDRPDGLVLTRRMARRYFGTDNPIGETLEIDRSRVMTVRAVLEDLPSNTHLDAEIFGSAKAVAGPDGPFGENARVYVYVRLKPGVSADEVRKGLVEVIDRYPRKAPVGKWSDSHYYPLVPIAAIHLGPTGAFAMKPGGDPRTIRAMAVVGVLVLLLASINFVNLKTARAARRAVEVGVRKVCGAGRRDLIVQFIGESLIYATLAMLIATALVELVLLPWLNAFVDRSIVFEYWRWPTLAYIVAAVLLIGTLAGVYPAFVLSSFRPSAVLKGTGPAVGGSGRVRQLLVIVQFAILIGLMVSTAIIYRQTQFGLDQGLRFDKEQLLMIDVPPADCEKSSFRSAVDALPGVLGAACSEFFLGVYGPAEYVAPNGRQVMLKDGVAGAGIFEIMGLAPVAGRFFARDREGDVLPPPRDRKPGMPFRVVVNETAAKALGFKSPAEAVGKSFRVPRADVRYDIIGVVPDLAGDTVRQSVWPTYYVNTAGWFSRLNVKLRGSTVAETLRAIDGLWSEVPGQTRPISRRFYNDYVQSIYASLLRQRTLFAGFALVALLLAGLGLFGLAGFTVERRTREIGVRKAMGANTGAVVRLLLWQFAKPVLWANVLAWPVAGYVMYRWLMGFAYRIELGVGPFVVASLVALGVAMITVGAHSVLVARGRAVAALRYE
jgi:putative ABC transport system permease protein